MTIPRRAVRDVVAAGAPVGAIAGLGIVAVVATGLGAVVGLGGILALTGASAMLGGVLGGYTGATAGMTDWNKSQELRHLLQIRIGGLL